MRPPDGTNPLPKPPDWGVPEDAARSGGGRSAQVASLVARILQERLARGLNDPRVQGLVSVLGVDLAGDMSQAVVRISVLPEDRSRLTLSGLRSAAKHLEGEVRKATRLRIVPRLRFELDDSIKREGRLMAALHEAAESTRTGVDPASETEAPLPGESTDAGGSSDSDPTQDPPKNG